MRYPIVSADAALGLNRASVPNRMARRGHLLPIYGRRRQLLPILAVPSLAVVNNGGTPRGEVFGGTHHGARSAARDPVRRARPRLPARGRPAHRPHHRRRGARPLAPSGARHGSPSAVHPTRGADRTDRRAQRHGARYRARPGGRMVARAMGPRPAADLGELVRVRAGRPGAAPSRRGCARGVRRRPCQLGLEITETAPIGDTTPRRGHAAGAARRRHPDRRRRLRHRLLVAYPPQGAGDRRDQDRPLLRRRTSPTRAPTPRSSPR